MKHFAVLILAAALLASCGGRPGHVSQQLAESDKALGAQEAETIKLARMLHKGMSFEQVAKVIPISKTNASMITHGGIQYDVLMGEYVVQMRFEHYSSVPHPRWKTNINETLLNSPVIVRNRSSGAVVLRHGPWD